MYRVYSDVLISWQIHLPRLRLFYPNSFSSLHHIKISNLGLSIVTPPDRLELFATAEELGDAYCK